MRNETEPAGVNAPQRVVVAGASGLIGTALVKALRGTGHDVRTLVRRTPVEPREIFWCPEAHELDPARIEGIDAVINLAGENIAGGRWTVAQRERILRSRVDATRTLVTTCARLVTKPSVFINASAIGIYGDAGDDELNEASPAGVGFLPETCLIWETNAEGAARAGIRTVLLRFGVVLAAKGGALAKMLPFFRLGLGGRMGPGTQWMSWTSVEDVVGVVQRALTDAKLTGAINVVAPEPVTNAEFTATLARVLKRPAMFPVPAMVLRAVFGEMATATILASARVRPERLLAADYEFRHATLEPALRAAVGR